MALEGSERSEADSVEGEAFTDWRDAQLPPGDRAEGDFRASEIPAFSTLGRTKVGLSGVYLSDEQNRTTNEARCADGRAPHDQDDGAGEDQTEREGGSEGNVDRGVPGLDVAAVGGEERPGPNGTTGTHSDNSNGAPGCHSDEPATEAADGGLGSGVLPNDGSRTPRQGRDLANGGEEMPEMREDVHQQPVDGQLPHGRTRADRVAALEADRRRERFEQLRNGLS